MENVWPVRIRGGTGGAAENWMYSMKWAATSVPMTTQVCISKRRPETCLLAVKNTATTTQVKLENPSSESTRSTITTGQKQTSQQEWQPPSRTVCLGWSAKAYTIHQKKSKQYTKFEIWVAPTGSMASKEWDCLWRSENVKAGFTWVWQKVWN